MGTVNYIIVFLLRWTVFVGAGLLLRKSPFIKSVKRRVDRITRSRRYKERDIVEPTKGNAVTGVEVPNALSGKVEHSNTTIIPPDPKAVAAKKGPVIRHAKEAVESGRFNLRYIIPTGPILPGTFKALYQDCYGDQAVYDDKFGGLTGTNAQGEINYEKPEVWVSFKNIPSGAIKLDYDYCTRSVDETAINRSLPKDLLQHIQHHLSKRPSLHGAPIHFPDSMFNTVIRWFNDASQSLAAVDYKVNINNFMGVWPIQIDTQKRAATFSVDHVKPLPGTALSPPGDGLTEEGAVDYRSILRSYGKARSKPSPARGTSSLDLTQLVLKKVDKRDKH